MSDEHPFARNVDPGDPANTVYTDLFWTIALATRYLQSSNQVPDEEMFERLASACDDATRYLANEHCEQPPPWLVAVGGLFHGMWNNARYARIVTEG